MRKDIRDLRPGELRDYIISSGEPAYRSSQVCEWLYGKQVRIFDEMQNIPVSLRKVLKENFTINSLELKEKEVSKDGVVKYLLVLKDSNVIETALIPSEDRLTLCVSTQAGCRFGCLFCASALGGFKRNLVASEITGQLIEVQRLTGKKVTNIVFMGVGEPLDNLDNLIASVDILNHDEGFGIGRRRMTVSTCGLVPGIEKLKDKKTGVGLSVSLHSADEAKRSHLIPVNRKYGLTCLKNALKDFTEGCGYPVTLEYVLIPDYNMRKKDAEKLYSFCRGLKSKLNFIPYNPVSEKPWRMPDKTEIGKFTSEVEKMNLFYTLRKPRGRDIQAACGQLRLNKQ